MAHASPCAAQSELHSRPRAIWPNGGRPLRRAAGYWDLYEGVDLPLATHKLPPVAMPGIAWYKLGFYNASTSEIFVPRINETLPDAVAHAMRRAYYASVSWMDACVGRVLDELAALKLESTTIVTFHGETAPPLNSRAPRGTTYRKACYSATHLMLAPLHLRCTADHGWQLGEHNSWHKFTNFELGARVPLIVRAPMLPTSAAKVTTVFAELVDIFPTLAELAGVPLDQDDARRVDGTSLVPVFADPSITALPNSKGTYNKTVAYSQYPHTSDWGCPYWREGLCYADGSTTGAGALPSASPSTTVRMGYTVRNARWRYTVWLPWNGTAAEWSEASAAPAELYDHSDDSGTDFDAMDVANLAYDAAHALTVAELLDKARFFFLEFLPPAHGPKPAPDGRKVCEEAHGIFSDDHVACCPVSCGACGGKGCAQLPGGKHSCCAGEVEKSGRKCEAVGEAPCVVS